MFKPAGCWTGKLSSMVALVVLLVGQAMTVMDGSILVVATPSLQANLHASTAEAQLVVAIYTLAFGALVVTGARLGDIAGRRRVFMLGLATFTAASLAGGLAPTPAWLVAARALAGAAAALMTPQVLSIIQAQFEGEARARAIGAYSMILAVGVAGGQILGGLLVSADLLTAAWRPALLINAPVGVALMFVSRRNLPDIKPNVGQRLDSAGAGLFGVASLALIVPLTLGREYHWPSWVWPCLAISVVTAVAFLVRERRLTHGDGQPLLDLRVFELQGVAAGVLAILLITSCYGGFLLSVTLHLQGVLRFSPIHAGLIFAIYASGFATASLTWTHASDATRIRLPIVGPLLMGAALLAVGLIASGGGWPIATAPLLFIAGAGHAYGFSPLANRLTNAIQRSQQAHLSGLILTASLVGQAIGVAAFAGIYLVEAAHGSAHALAMTTAALAATLLVTALCARQALASTPRCAHPRDRVDQAPDQVRPRILELDCPNS
jgi:MFS family permease